MLAGLGGAALSLAYTPGWTENITGGHGWIAIALVIFATWNPYRALLGALFFGGVNAIQFRLQAAGTTIPAPFLNMLPYLFTIVVLTIVTVYENVASASARRPRWACLTCVENGQDRKLHSRHCVLD